MQFLNFHQPYLHLLAFKHVAIYDLCLAKKWLSKLSNSRALFQLPFFSIDVRIELGGMRLFPFWAIANSSAVLFRIWGLGTPRISTPSEMLGEAVKLRQLKDDNAGGLAHSAALHRASRDGLHVRWQAGRLCGCLSAGDRLPQRC